MVTKSIAEELLSCVSPYNYTKEISCLTMDDFVVIKQFPSSELGKIFTIDRLNCKQDGETNYAQLFELFRSFSDEDAESVRSDTMERIQTGSSVYEVVGWSFLRKDVLHLENGPYQPAIAIIMGMKCSSMHYAGSFIAM